MGTIKPLGENVAFTFKYNPAIIDQIKLVFRQRFFDGDNKIWIVGRDEATPEILGDFVERYGFAVEGLPVKLPELKKTEAYLRSVRSETDWKYPEGILKLPLMPYQVAGVEFMAEKRKVLLADEMGLGKSGQAIATVELERSFPCIVICPASLKYNWEKEIKKFTSSKARVLSSGDYIFTGTGWEYFIINYDILGKIDLSKVGHKSLICDESHVLSNKSTKRSKAVMKYVGVDRVFLLTGTPIYNKPVGLVNQLATLGVLKQFGGYYEFTKRYCSAFRSSFGMNVSGASNLGELNIKLRESVMIRREKKDVLKDLPPKRRIIIDCQLTNMSMYLRAKNDIVDFIKETKGSEHSRFNSMAEAIVQLTALKKLTAEGKLKQFYEWVDEFLETGKKLIVFAIHTAIVEAIAERYKCRVITGKVPSEKRQNAVDDFQENPDTKIIACNIEAGGVGFNMTEASDVAILELPWTSTHVEQAIDRAHRHGQKDSVTAWFFLAEKTIDLRIYDLIEMKRQQAEQAIGVDGKTNYGEAGNDSVAKSILKELYK